MKLNQRNWSRNREFPGEGDLDLEKCLRETPGDLGVERLEASWGRDVGESFLCLEEAFEERGMGEVSPDQVGWEGVVP